jgi:preprotein translocase subunit SecF
MIWGIFVATYSSIFICSPMLIYLGVRADAFDKGADAADVDPAPAKGTV